MLLFYFISWLERWVVKIGELIIVECFAFAFVPPRQRGYVAKGGKRGIRTRKLRHGKYLLMSLRRGYGLHTHSETNEKEP